MFRCRPRRQIGRSHELHRHLTGDVHRHGIEFEAVQIPASALERLTVDTHALRLWRGCEQQQRRFAERLSARSVSVSLVSNLLPRRDADISHW